MDRKPIILLVDDESHILHVVGLKLSGAGYRILTAADGEEGLEAALAHHPDLIISDYQMPYMSGLELGARLGQRQETRRIPIVMLTARGFDLPRQQIEHANVVDVISKPFSPRDILYRVDELLGRESRTKRETAS